MTSLKFHIFENDDMLPLSQMTEPETYSIGLCIEDLLPQPNGNYWFEIDMFLLDEDGEEPAFGLLYCYEDSPKHEKTSRPLPKELLDTVEGKTLRLEPKQYGVNSWGKKVEVRFETLTNEES